MTFTNSNHYTKLNFKEFEMLLLNSHFLFVHYYIKLINLNKYKRSIREVLIFKYLTIVHNLLFSYEK